MRKQAIKAALGAAGLLGAALLAGCVATPNNDRTELREAGDGFPALADNWHDNGQFVNPEDVLRITTGQTKRQVRELLGNPHFAEGFFQVREWNYVFNLYTQSGDNYMTCQYQVHFSDDMVVEETRWRDAQCPSLLVPIEVGQDPQDTSRDMLTISGDVLFDFDSDQLSLEGRRALTRVADKALSDYQTPALHIVGHTDRFGDAQYNVELSRARADTAAGYLSEQGIAHRNIQTLGKGSAEPLVSCSGSTATPQVKACLRPNRRVEFTLSEPTP